MAIGDYWITWLHLLLRPVVILHFYVYADINCGVTSLLNMQSQVPQHHRCSAMNPSATPAGQYGQSGAAVDILLANVAARDTTQEEHVKGSNFSEVTLVV